MTALGADAWSDGNQSYLRGALTRVRRLLEAHAASRADGGGTSKDGHTEAAAARRALAEAAAELQLPPSLELLAGTFGLSAFERDVLLLCAGVELDAGFASLCAAAHGDPARPYPTFGLALAALPDAHWSALTPQATLRYWRLVEVAAGGGLTSSPIHVDESILHYLNGLPHGDDRLAGLVTPVPAFDLLAPSHRTLAERVARVWPGSSDSNPPVLLLCGPDQTARQSIAGKVAAAIGLRLFELPAELIPVGPSDLDGLVRLWERHAVLGAGALLVACDGLEINDTQRAGATARFIEQAGTALIVSARERWRVRSRPTVTLDVPWPGMGEQRSMWRDVLGPDAAGGGGQVDRLVGQFRLSAAAIRAAADETRQGGPDARDFDSRLWAACRVQARPAMEGVAQRVDTAADWEDLVLPERQRRMLGAIVLHVRWRARVYEEWGFAAKGARGLGISALFAGASGTGKTLAAEVLANRLRLDLYRIDLSQVVSKYIGETEKNLGRVFDAAEDGGAVLLFDEADALFGKRSDVKDSHDRYANIEVSYLLQRMEAYRGLAILTTNLKSALDQAFMRRIRFVVEFPYPDDGQRAEIWRRVFPEATPLGDLDWAKLARLNLAGGNIRNIALHSAFLAADSDEPVSMAHLLDATRNEYTKLEKPLTEAEIRGWA
jgi:hypothetical protein